MSVEKQKISKGPARGATLLRDVYAELYASLGQIYSPREILIAAQRIIDIHSLEYSDELYQEGSHSDTEYSKPVDLMILNRPWSVLRLEQRCDNLEDQRFESNNHGRYKLKRFYNPDVYLHRG